ncbi:hypothetical protein KQI86_13015 [Clostridium sp. MSJ-11]|uniref:Uncharacterized protein n=1 Tax=Clostridium mobile TaxID=2841512 RepID=A0ABS6EKC9_9CLOT|nr:hypothetical protein [Clostridium mobile]MBU5485257.1 hypothetical protein [Clostridium mobile]
MFLKVKNFMDKNVDYKGLIIDSIKPFSQSVDYDKNESVFIYNDTYEENEDIIEITEEEYLMFKEEIENKLKQPTEVDLLKQQIESLSIAMAKIIGM